MKIKILILFFFLITNNLFSENVDTTLAKIVALNTMRFKTKNKYRLNIEKVIITQLNEIVTGYIINFKEGGFVVVSADNNTVPVFAYSETGKYDQSENQPAFEDWLNYYNESVYKVKTEGIKNQSNRVKWEQIINNEFTDKKDIAEIQPLIKTHWGQDVSNDAIIQHECDAYNFYVDVTNNHCYCSGSEKCPAGCVPVAMAQIMKYWAHPFYDWCNMPDKLIKYVDQQGHINPNYITERNTIASLLKDCGVHAWVVYCNFDKCESGATTAKAKNALVHYFKYSKKANKADRFWHSDSEWKDMLRNDLNQSQPVFYSARDQLSGHAFVCDGYGYLNEDDYFHFNFGYNGNDDAYCFIDYIIVGDHWYFDSQDAIFNIYPDPGKLYDCNNEITVYQYFRTDPFFMNLFYSPYANKIFSQNVEIENGDVVQYHAYEKVSLKNFRVRSGGHFSAKVSVCPAKCGDYTQKSYEFGTTRKEVIAEQDSQNFSEELIIIYPNPATSEINIQFQTETKETQVTTSIFDIYGNKVFYKEQNPEAGEIIKVNTGRFAKGIYFVKVTTADYTETQKVIIQ
jgi:hypothetical protein